LGDEQAACFSSTIHIKKIMPDVPVTIRPAAHSDIMALTALLQILFSIEEDFVFNTTLQRQGLELMIGNEQCCVMVADVNGQAVGMCSGQVTISTAEGGPALLVEDVIIQEEYRRLGIGRLLMQEVAEWGRSKGVLRLQLLADSNNDPALKFYKRLDWQSTNLVCLRKFPVQEKS